MAVKRTECRTDTTQCGAPREEVVEQSLLTGVRELIIPGLEHLGLPTAKIHEWL